MGANFSAPDQTGSEAHPASYTVGTGSLPGVKQPGCGVDHPPPSSAEVNERVELYFFSPSGPSWPCCSVKCQGRPNEFPFGPFTVPEHKLHERV